MNKVLVKLGLGYLAKWMNGYKSYTGSAGKILAGVASMATGIAGILQCMFPEQGMTPPDPEVQIGMIVGGFYAISSGLQGIGVAHKIEKGQSKPEIVMEHKIGDISITQKITKKDIQQAVRNQVLKE